ncbi:MAG: ABC transporter ATP-binding protein [Rhizobiaceae bacterium]|nr:ABC transporter ATP-binding protein [Rhizobiaceae bacterium]MCC0043547.1 ABC transporter ATP-binding protein [Brucellaceae bacterium]
MIQVEHLTSSYGRITAVSDASLEVGAGEIVSLIGANGAGKTTLMRTLSGIHMPGAGRIQFDGQDITQMTPAERVRRGLVQVPEGRRVFGPMSVEDNLILGGATATPANRRRRMNEAFDLFPILRERRDAQANSLSGGEQQMLAIARALMAAPRLLLLDEPSLGLAPKIIVEILSLIQTLNGRGTAVLLVEQNAVAALQISHRAYVMETGRITRSGNAAVLRNDPSIRAAYLGG